VGNRLCNQMVDAAASIFDLHCRFEKSAIGAVAAAFTMTSGHQHVLSYNAVILAHLRSPRESEPSMPEIQHLRSYTLNYLTNRSTRSKFPKNTLYPVTFVTFGPSLIENPDHSPATTSTPPPAQGLTDSPPWPHGACMIERLTTSSFYWPSHT